MLRQLVIAVFSVTASAQTIQLTGGGSSLFDAEGAQAKIMFARSTTALSGGLVGGHVYIGATETTKIHGLEIAAGDMTLPFTLPTDFTQAPSFPAVGLAISGKSNAGQWTAFMGETATSYSTPFFFGSKTAAVTAALFGSRKLTKTLSFDSAEVFSDRQTAIETLTFRPVTPLIFSIAGGLGDNSPFAGGRLGYKTQHWDGVVNWTHHGTAFQRIALPYETVNENTGLNAALKFNSRHFYASADHANYNNALKTGTIRSTVNSVNVGGSLSVVTANSSFFFGESAGKPVSGKTEGVGFNAGWLAAHADRYESSFGSTTSVTVIERPSRHFSVNEFIQAHAVNLGGEYHSNRMTLSGGYSMSFFPVLNQFERVLSAQITIQLPNAMTLTGGTLTTPDGHTRWTAYGNKYAQGPMSDVQLGRSHPTGRYIYTGKFVTPDGEPVSGALKIGKQVVYADTHGKFFLPTNRPKALPLTVTPEDFIAAGRWAVVSAPTSMLPDSPVTIVVRQSI